MRTTSRLWPVKFVLYGRLTAFVPITECGPARPWASRPRKFYSPWMGRENVTHNRYQRSEILELYNDQIFSLLGSILNVFNFKNNTLFIPSNGVQPFLSYKLPAWPACSLGLRVRCRYRLEKSLRVRSTFM